jgi:putative acetyltransferase
MFEVTNMSNIIIRHETPNDYEAVREILKSSFETDAESRLVDALRTNGKAIFSLVAEQAQTVVGHIMFSPVSTTPPSEPKGLGLAPVAVAPTHRRQGIASMLIREGLRMCNEYHYDYVILLGDPKFYQRFGFQKASNFGLQNEYGVDDPFMVIELKQGVLAKVNGLVQYGLEFVLFSV